MSYEGSAGKRPQPETLVARLDNFLDSTSGSVIPPIYPSATYARGQDYEQIGGRGYSRDENPTYEPVEAVLNKLEGGAATALFSTGMTAVACLIQALRPGDRIVASSAQYFGTPKFLREVAIPWGLQVDFVDTSDADALVQAVRSGPVKLIFIETPSNPLWSVTDIALTAELAREAGAVLAVDSTSATPVLTRPIELGADLVLHSATKYLNGHSDVLAGAIVAARQDALWERIYKLRYLAGYIVGPFEAWLLGRGMRTLFVRVERSCSSAMKIARHFEGHPALAQVCYPGLEGDPGHTVASRQMQGGYGGMLSLRMKGGSEAALAMIVKLRHFHRATSLGGVESLIEHRHTVESPDTEVPDDLLRLSIGLEAVDDLIEDLEQALAT